jgi:hypothetical protein
LFQWFVTLQWPLHGLIRKPALDWMASYIHAEDLQTNHIDIGPVNKVLNMMACFIHDGPDSPLFLKHKERIPDYLWMCMLLDLIRACHRMC